MNYAAELFLSALLMILGIIAISVIIVKFTRSSEGEE